VRFFQGGKTESKHVSNYAYVVCLQSSNHEIMSKGLKDS
jgi:hypothetical protein